jgi:hypothetical protein
MSKVTEKEVYFPACWITHLEDDNNPQLSFTKNEVPMTTTPKRRILGASLLLLLPLTAISCSKDTNDSVETAAANIASDASEAIDNGVQAADSVIGDGVESTAMDTTAMDSAATNSAAEGKAKGLAMAMAASLTAMSGGGEATVANLDTAAKLVPAPDKVTGIEDSDGNGIDDDAKATVETNNGDDKACVQSQNGVWEVTDDEC